MDWSPVWISIKPASLSIVITFFLGILAAWGIVSCKSQKAKMVWDGILTMPLVLPPTVAGFFLLYIFGVKRPLGSLFLNVFGIKIAFSWGATVLAAAVISFPLMYRSARGAFEQVDENLVAAARTLGIRRCSCFCQRAGRIWSHCHDSGEYCRKNQDSSFGSIFRGGGRQHGKGLRLRGGDCGHCLLRRSAYELGRSQR